MPVPARFRARSARAAAPSLIVLALVAVAACGSGGEGSDDGANASPSTSESSGVGPSESATATTDPGETVASASPTPEAETPKGPAPDAIRALDAAALPWQWWENELDPPLAVVPGTPDGLGRTYTAGTPVYSDANGDGLEDAAVPLAQADGNGYREHWHIWLADPAGGAPTQVLEPFAATTRCGDLTDSVTPVAGGFAVHEWLRGEIVDAWLDCVTPGTTEISRSVGVTTVDGVAWPVSLTDPAGWGGLCPAHNPTEPWSGQLWAGAVPTLTAPLTIDGVDTTMGELQSGVTRPPFQLYPVWPEGVTGERLCVWVDLGRYEGGGE